MNVLIPLIDKVKYVHSLKEITVDIPQQTAVCSGWLERILCLSQLLLFR